MCIRFFASDVIDHYELNNNIDTINQNLIGLILPIKDTNSKVLLVNHIQK